jgi:hypothetical protein
MINLYTPFQRWFRPRRVRLLFKLLNVTENTRVLDMGGGAIFWDLAASLGLQIPQVTVLNIRPAGDQERPFLKWIQGDARATQFDDRSFDLVFSNSLIEHLGDLKSQAKFALEVQRLAPNYFVQTPDRRFPIEPHLLAPFVHWLPDGVRRRAIRNFSVWGLLNRPSSEKCEELVREIRLLSGSQMKELFPHANLVTERFMGLPKSVIAVRVAQSSIT